MFWIEESDIVFRGRVEERLRWDVRLVKFESGEAVRCTQILLSLAGSSLDGFFFDACCPVAVVCLRGLCLIERYAGGGTLLELRPNYSVLRLGRLCHQPHISCFSQSTISENSYIHDDVLLINHFLSSIIIKG
jgi:hypothetical protein